MRFPRYFSLAGLDTPHRQETQIVQSCMTLDDFLPGFWLPPVRWSALVLLAVAALWGQGWLGSYGTRSSE